MSKNLIETAKKLAARTCIDEQVLPYLKPNAVIGIGSGSTVVYAVERLVEQVKRLNLDGQVKCVPSSYQAINLINESGCLVLSDLLGLGVWLGWRLLTKFEFVYSIFVLNF